ncbi:transcription factor bHLH61 [Arachis hypogaea]|nr:transcription factor SCREAM2 [Arachis hypogaea]
MPLDEEVKEIKGIQERKKEREAYMSSRGRKKAAMQRMLQQLRTATNSSAMNKASIIVDATKYMEELKQKVEGINSELGTVGSSSSTSQDELPMVTVETLERGFLINVFSERNCPGMLVAILEAFEELGLDVLDARVSCEDNFQLEAVGGEGQDQKESIDAQVVKQAVLQAINNMN